MKQLTAQQTFLVNANRHLAVSLADRMTPAGNADLREDTLSEALLALTKASSEWYGYCDRNQHDPSAVGMFEIYAWKCITGAILDMRRRNGRIPYRYLALYRQIQEAGLHRSLRELEATLGVPQIRISAIIALASLRDGGQIDEVSMQRGGLSHGGDTGAIEEWVQDALDQLPQELQDVVMYRVLDEMKFIDIALEIGVSRKRAMDMYAQGIAQLRTVLKETACPA